MIVLHARGIEGWVEGADLVFRSKTNSANYHDEMNHEHYIEWLTEQMLLNLQDNSVIVLDDATCMYHNKLKDIHTTNNSRQERNYLELATTTQHRLSRS